ncbi:MAG: EF-P lysine aminoacylase GenX [Methylococcales bacterium]|nr:EF-P lysine aminoacylase GenX [Methylococcales bacterium]MBT7445436.1 EF-P lysine aminoacylase GenX [Methylococcales bacterium]
MPHQSKASSWRPNVCLETLQKRAAVLAAIRQYFQQQHVLEVETPYLAKFGVTDPAIENFKVATTFGEKYLQSSPEYHMKRLLADGSGDIYQIARVFREGELGAKHQPEFTLLEWYRLGFSHLNLIEDVVRLLETISGFQLEHETKTYSELFLTYLNIDPLQSTCEQLQSIAELKGIHLNSTNLTKDGWLDLLLSHCIEPKLGQDGLCFVVDYPVSQAALAQVSQENPLVAHRFELYWQGIELANGYDELTDANELRRRFERDASGLDIDEYVMSAQESGLPSCAGVALGLDRLLMILFAEKTIDQVMAFSANNA